MTIAGEGGPLVAPANLVVVDTDCYSKLYVLSSPGPQVRDLRDRLVGKIPVIATQTEVELRAWPLVAGWGRPRAERFRELLAQTTTVPVTEDVAQAHVDLYVACRKTGHALHQKVHNADRWVAATAIAVDRPLLSLDGIFRNAPLVKLLPEL